MTAHNHDPLSAPIALSLLAYDEELAGESGEPHASPVWRDADEAAYLDALRGTLDRLELARLARTPRSGAASDDTPAPFGERTRVAGGREQIGRFTIVRELGRGGCGIVFLAHDPQLSRRVALKVPRPEALVSAEMRERFLREAHVAARLDHPNLVAVHEVGEDGAVCYIASAYCEGPTLVEWLKSRREPVGILTAARMVKQLAEAVQHAHSRGVLHRDIKPSNVLLSGPEREGANGAAPGDPLAAAGLSPKLADFGLAKLLERGGDDTRSGTILGTPAYMAPEQAQGSLRDVDARADVYALGALLYEILTGRRVVESGSEADVLRRLLFEEPAGPRRLRPEIPRDLEAIVLRALAKNRDARYATAQALADDLERFLSGRPTEARPLGAAGRLGKWARRRPAMAALFAVVAVAAASLVGIVIAYNARLSAEVTRAEREADTSRRLLYAAEVRLANEAFKANNVPQALELLGRQVPRSGQEDLRGFAWHYLYGLAHQEALALVGHTDEVFCVAYSPDGRQLATASKDGTARLWDAASGTARHVIDGHTDEVTRVAFSPDGRLLATASEDRTVRLWDASTAQPRGVLRGHGDHVMAIAFSPDGRLLASGSWDSTVRVWDVERQALERVFDSPSSYVEAVAFSPDGSMLVAGDTDGAVHCWRTRDWQKLRGANNPAICVLALAFSRDLAWLAGAGRGHGTGIRLWRWNEKGLHLITVTGREHLDWVQCLAFSPLDNSLASCDKAGIINVWSLAAPDSPHTLLGHAGRVWSVAWSPDGRRLASAGADRTVRIWDVARALHSAGAGRFPATPAPIGCVAASPDQARLITGSEDGYVRVWDLASRRLASARATHEGRVSWVRVSPDGTRLASGSEQDGKIKIVDMASGRAQFVLDGSPGHSPTLAWSPDGNTLAMRTEPTCLTIVDAHSGQELGRANHEHDVAAVEFSPDGTFLVTAAELARLHDPHTGEVLRTLEPADCVAVSPDGQWVAGARRADVTVWNARNGARLRFFPGQYGVIDQIRFSPRGRTLAASTPGNPATITLWDIGAGQELIRLEAAPGAYFEDFAFTPRGDRLIAVGWEDGRDGNIWEWSLKASEPLRTAPAGVAAPARRLAAEDAIPLKRAGELLAMFDRAPDGTHQAVRVRFLPSAKGRHALPSAATLHTVPVLGLRKFVDERIPGPEDVVAYDFDRNGAQDVAVARRDDLYLFMNEGGGRRFSTRSWPIRRMGAIRAADLDGDDVTDLVFTADDQIGWIRFDGQGNPHEPTTIAEGLAVPEQFAVCDLDGDGDADLVLASSEDHRVSTIENRGGGRFDAPQTIDDSAGHAVAVAAADLDGDGDADVLAAAWDEQKLAWYANDGRGRFAAQRIITGNADRVCTITAADLDGDGDHDILTAGGHQLLWFAGDGAGNFDAGKELTHDLDRDARASVADLDGDGDVDVLVADAAKDRACLFLNEGHGRFHRTVLDNRLVRCAGTAAADLNGDGRLDLIVTAQYGDEVLWWENVGTRFDVVPESRQRLLAPNVLEIARPGEASLVPVDGDAEVRLRFEDLDGRPLSKAEVESLVARVAIYRDSNRSGTVEPEIDWLVGAVSRFTPDDGTITIPLEADASPSTETTKRGDNPWGPSCCELMRAVNAWATEHGYAGGYPTFARTERDGKPAVQVVLLRPSIAKMVDLPQGLFARPFRQPLSDFENQRDLVIDTTARLNRWAQAKGYGGALFGAQVTVDARGELAYQALLLKISAAEQRDLRRDELGTPSSIEALFQAAHKQAQNYGHLSGFPSFEKVGNTVSCIMIDSAAAEVVDIPLVELR